MVGIIYNGTEEIGNTGNSPKILLFPASQMMSASPVEEWLRIELNWSLSSSSSVGQLYGRMIHQAFDGRPWKTVLVIFESGKFSMKRTKNEK